MKNVVYFTDQAAIKKEAAHWIARLDGDVALTPDERQELRAWIHRSPDHRQALHDAAALWDSFNILTELAPEAIEDAGSEPATLETVNQHGGAFPSYRPRFAFVAAAATVLIFGAFFFFQYSSWRGANGYHATAVGEQRSIQLADGSEVKLNTDTRVEIKYSNNTRDITLLRGEAHFEVAENKRTPFRVNAGSGQVLALGTAFSVYIKETSVDVVVTEGSVAVSALSSIANGISNTDVATQEQKGLVLDAGQLAVIRKAGTNDGYNASKIERRNLSNQELAQRVLWKDGILLFSRAPLRDVVAEISRYTTMEIEYASADVAEMLVIARFPVGDTELMLNVFEESFGLSVTYSAPDRVLLSAKEEVETN